MSSQHKTNRCINEMVLKLIITVDVLYLIVQFYGIKLIYCFT